MKYFTKEYIKECDCEQIQGLRAQLKQGDWVFSDFKNSTTYDNYMQGFDYGLGTILGDTKTEKIYWIDFVKWGIEGEKLTDYTREQYRKTLIWLPTGDQLDEEITKIISDKFFEDKLPKDDFNPWYQIEFDSLNKVWWISFWKDHCGPVEINGKTFLDIIEPDIFIQHNNPLIAKIKLLKQLLEAK